MVHKPESAWHGLKITGDLTTTDTEPAAHITLNYLWTMCTPQARQRAKAADRPQVELELVFSRMDSREQVYLKSDSTLPI